jgi:ubiquinone/menaquinone biosynthesis C-methylase UbiE
MENLVPKHTYKNTLELGIGNNQHKKYVLHSYSLYIGIDLQSKFFSDVEFVKGDVSFIPFKNNSVQRIIVTCLLHHIGSVIKVLTEIKRIIDEDSKGRMLGIVALKV